MKFISPMSQQIQSLRRRSLAAALAGGLVLGAAGDGLADPQQTAHSPNRSEQPSEDPFEHPAEHPISDYRARARSQARSYDRTQDVSPEQLLRLLEVSERTGANLGQALATGEFESAGTWNDFVRPTLGDGSLGSATGVWQFIPNTFFLIIKRYGDEILAASSADPEQGRDQLDLSSGPFCDAQVRRIIRETVDGTRAADDEPLQLLRHNFAVLAFAKHFLSVESGATTPEEDYLFHFLGETRGRQVLALANGEAAHTLSVKQPDATLEGIAAEMAALNPAGGRALSPRVSHELRTALPRATRGSADRLSDDHASPDRPGLIGALRGLVSGRGLGSGSGSRESEHSDSQVLPESAVYHPAASDIASPWPPLEAVPQPERSSEWGLPADSPIVTGNPGMFYRNASARADPYTWAEFVDALAARVQSRRQPAMVRAKYGVGFQLDGGDMPEWAFDASQAAKLVEFHDQSGGSVLLPDKLLTAPLDADEMQAYKARLAELIARGEAEPLAEIPSYAVLALQHLGVLAPEVTEVPADSAELRQALAAFRALAGKHQPDDPALADRLMPTERVALELYEQRLAQYAALQSGQQTVLSEAIDLLGINALLKRHRRASRPYVARLQRALAEEGLQTQTRGYQPPSAAHFDGIAGKLTVGALNRFQLSHGLRVTDGRLDPVTAGLLGLPPMGLDSFLPPAGPQCRHPAQPDREPSEAAPHCAVPIKPRPLSIFALLQQPKAREADWSWRLLALADATDEPPLQDVTLEAAARK
jgi:hypothetical protein